MMSKFIFKNISFQLFIGCIWLTSFPLISHAATMQITEKSSSSVYALSENLPGKYKKSPSLPSQPTNTIASSSETIKNTLFKEQQTANFQSNIKEIGKTLFFENSDNKYVQDALTTYTEAKQFYTETDEILTDLTQDLILQLELDQSYQNTLFSSQLNNNHNSYSSTSYQHDLYRVNPLNSNPQTTKLFIYEEPGNLFSTIYKQIFQIRTLFYLAALTLFFPVLNWCLRQLFIQRY